MHELGHSLGILHSEVKEAVMHAIAFRGRPYMGLHEDDILAIQALYGNYSFLFNKYSSHSGLIW